MLYQVDRHLRKLDQELAKFKMELEADNAGITEILERRELGSGLCFWNSLFSRVVTPPKHPQALWRWTAHLSQSTTIMSTLTPLQRVSRSHGTPSSADAAQLPPAQVLLGWVSFSLLVGPERKYSTPIHHTTEHIPEKKFKSEALLSTLTSDASKENTPG